jgi:hypothetical protein
MLPYLLGEVKTMSKKIGELGLLILLSANLCAAPAQPLKFEKIFTGYSDKGKDQYLHIRLYDKKTLNGYLEGVAGHFFSNCIRSKNYKKATVTNVKSNTNGVTSSYFINISVQYDNSIGTKNKSIRVTSTQGDSTYYMQCVK